VTRRWLFWVAQAASIIVGIIVGIVSLIAGYFWVLGLPGRVAESKFEQGLNRGMSPSQVRSLKDATHGQEVADYDSSDPAGSIEVRFVDSVSICVGSGKTFHILFDDQNRLRSWRVSRWVDSC
jgi:hypothetical protein